MFMLTGCGRSSNYYSLSEGDKLTSSERQALVSYSRKFLLRSKIPLNPFERNIISRTPPVVNERYTDRKTGDIMIKWCIKDKKTITVKGTGDLLKEQDCFWKVSIFRITQNEFGKKK